jgi:ATP-dependent DNA helicase 2 subunit 2
MSLSNHGYEDTSNIINERNGGYDNVNEYIPIGQPNAAILSKIDALEPSEVSGDRAYPYT